MSVIQTGQTCFALWRDKYYYPAVIEDVLLHRVKVAFLDGHKGEVREEDIVDLQEAFKTMRFQGRWKNGLVFYKGTITSHNPMVMKYDDGYVEQIELKQLRGRRSDNPF